VEKETKRLSRSQRKRIRSLKEKGRDELFFHGEDSGWESMQEILRLKIADYDIQFGKDTKILHEFYNVRRKMILTGSMEPVRLFYEQYKDSEKENLIRLKNPLSLISKFTEIKKEKF